MELYGVILAGGRGKRFWPVSRKSKPKQFLPIVGDKAMICQTVDRVHNLIPLKNLLVVTSENLVQALQEVLPQLPVENILAEPIGRNTAPAIAWAASVINKRDPQGIIAVFASDHVISDSDAFCNTLKNAKSLCERKDALVTLGISPTRPETGYGYIKIKDVLRDLEFSAYEVEKFVEKPSLEIAERYVSSGKYLWNSGMFIFSVHRILQELRKSQPHMLDSINEVLDSPDQTEALQRIFPTVLDISIDYGIMENASDIVTIPIDYSWADVGSWESLYDYIPASESGNHPVGDNILIECQNTLVWGGKKLIAGIGLEDLIIVDTEDALLICKRDKSQQVNDVISYLDRRQDAKKYI